MEVVHSIYELRALVHDARCGGRQIGLVPTLGYLHSGHLTLATRARIENGLTVMSIYVNPTQFGPEEDFARYPRNLIQDRTLAEEHGVDVLFVPDNDTMYPDGPTEQRVWVDPGALAKHLCGASRPGHFRGVATVVGKLLNMVQPDRAYFGQKDAQQAAIVTRMVRDLSFPVEIRILPTVREADGVALSSRNVYLSSAERSQANVLYRALTWACGRINAGDRDAHMLEAGIRSLVLEAAHLARIDYVSVADMDTLQPVQGKIEHNAIVALAVYFGETRLIDNILVHFEGDHVHCT